MLLLFVTVISLLLAAILSVVAWRISVHERHRSDARVDALAAEIHGTPASDFPAITYRQDADLPLRPALSSTPDMFGSMRPTAQPQLATVMGIAGLVLVAVVAGALGLSGIARRAAAHDTTVAGPPAAPLELVTLDQERKDDELVVRGLVRNPETSSRIDDVAAIVIVFASDGGFVASGRATIASVSLGPGGESPFTVTIPNAKDVGRFRVSFRTDDRVIAHVDRRQE